MQLSWVLCFRVSYKAVIKLLARTISRLDWRGIHFQGHSCKIQFLMAVSQKPPSVFWHMGLSIRAVYNMAACFSQASKREEPERVNASKMQVTIFYNLIKKITFHYVFAYSLLEASHSVQSRIQQGQGIIQWHEYQNHWVLPMTNDINFPLIFTLAVAHIVCINNSKIYINIPF